MPSLAEIVLEGGRLRSDALRRNAEIVADAQRNKGLLWGAALSNAGQNVAGAFQHAADLKAEQPMRDANLKLANQAIASNDQNAEANRQKDWDTRTAQAKKQAIDNLMGSSLGDGGLYDIDKLSANLDKYGMTADKPAQVAMATSFNENMRKSQQVQRDALGSLAAGIANSGYEPDVALNHARLALHHQLITQPQFDEFTVSVARDPGHVKQLTDALLGQSSKEVQALVKTPDLMAQPIGEPLIDKRTGQVVVPASAPKPANSQESEFMLDGHRVKGDYIPGTGGQGGKYLYHGQDVTGRAQGIPPASQQNVDPNQTIRNDPDALDYLATQYRVLGAAGIPTRISELDRVAAIKAAAAQVKSLGQTPAMAVQKQAAFKADAASLTKMQAMSSSAEAFENKAIEQTKIIDDLSSKVGRTMSPALNAIWQTGKMAVTGDSPTTQLYNAISTFSSEYAKIMEGSTGSVAASSDSSRAAAKRLIDASMNPKTMSDVVNLMKREMALTLQGYDATISHITDRMGGTAPNAKDPLGLGIIK